MKFLDLRSDLVISFEIAPSGLNEGDPVTPVTVTIKNQGESISASTKAFFGYFPFFGSGAIFLPILNVYSATTWIITESIGGLEPMDCCLNGRYLHSCRVQAFHLHSIHFF